MFRGLWKETWKLQEIQTQGEHTTVMQIVPLGKVQHSPKGTYIWNSGILSGGKESAVSRNLHADKYMSKLFCWISTYTGPLLSAMAAFCLFVLLFLLGKKVKWSNNRTQDAMHVLTRESGTFRGSNSLIEWSNCLVCGPHEGLMHERVMQEKKKFAHSNYRASVIFAVQVWKWDKDSDWLLQLINYFSNFRKTLAYWIPICYWYFLGTLAKF